MTVEQIEYRKIRPSATRRWGLFALLAAYLLAGSATYSRAAQAVWTQDDWSGGVSVSAAADPGDRGGWVFYSQAHAGISTGTALSVHSDMLNWSLPTAADPSGGYGRFQSETDVLGYGSTTYITLARNDYSSVSWESLLNVPVVVGYGGSMVYDGGDYIYLMPGAVTTNFYRYSISGNTWSSLAAVPCSVSYGGDLVYDGGDYLYAFCGGNTSGFYRYSISGNSWLSRAAFTLNATEGAALAYAGGDYIYAIRGGSWSNNNNAGLSRYSISANQWGQNVLAPLMYEAEGSTLHYPGYGDYLYLMRGGGTVHMRYSITGNVWAGMAAFPVSAFRGSHLTYPGRGGDTYSIFGSSSAVTRYNISSNSHSHIPGLPSAAIERGGSIVADSSGTLYVTPGLDTQTFWRLPEPKFQASGTYTSPVYDTGAGFDYYDISWSSFVPTGGGIKVEVRAGNALVPDGTWTAWQEFGNGDSLGAGMDYRRYVQWRSSFTTVDTSTSPVLYGLTIRYQGWGLDERQLVSSVYDSGSAGNSLRGLKWDENIPSPADAYFQVRTSPDNAAWTGWQGPGGTESTYFTDPAGGETVPYALRDGVGDRYFQYKAFLKGGGNSAPEVAVASVTYGALAPPVLTGLTPASSTQITILFNDAADDEDDFAISTAAGAGAIGVAGVFDTADKPGTGAQSGAMTGLTPNTLYYLRLRSHESQNPGGGYSAYSNEFSTYTLAALPAAAGAAYNAYPSSITINWSVNNNPNGTIYKAERATSEDFSAGYVMGGWTSNTSYTFEGLSLGTTYYFRVRARNAYNIETATVALRAAQPVAAPLPAPVPAQGGVQSATVTWTANGNPAYAYYQAVRATDAAFSAGTATSAWTSDLSYAFTGLAPDAVYYFRVRAANPGLDTSAWVSLGSTRTLANPPVFTAAPSGEAGKDWLEVDFSPSTNPSTIKYEVRLSSTPDFSSVLSSYVNISTASWTFLAQSGITNPRDFTYPGSGDYIYATGEVFKKYSIPNDVWTTLTQSAGGMRLTYGGDGYFYAVAADGTANFYRFSIAQETRETLPSVPVAIPSDGGGTAVAAGGYVYVTRGSNLAGFYRYSIAEGTWASMADDVTVGYWSKTVYAGGDFIYVIKGGASPGKKFYKYSISADSWTALPDVTCEFGPYSGLAYAGGGYIYTVCSNRYLLRYSIPGNSWGQALPQVWSSEYGAGLAHTGQALYYVSRNYTGSTHSQKYTPVPSLFTGLSGLATYYAQARALNSAGTRGEWVSLGSAGLGPLAPSSATYSPAATSITLSWRNPNYQAADVYLELAANPGFSGPVDSGWLSASTTFYTFGGLAADTVYYFRIRAREASQTSNESGWRVLHPQKTSPYPPSSGAHLFISSGGVHVQWGANGNSAGVNYQAQLATDPAFSNMVSSTNWTADAFSAYLAASPNTYYYARVRARSSAGIETSWTSLPPARTYADKPGAPSVTAAGGDSVTVNWSLGGNPSGTEFWAEVALSSDPWGFQVSTFGWTTSLSKLFSALQPATTYHIRLKARNVLGFQGLNSSAPDAEQWTAVVSTCTKTRPLTPSSLNVDLEEVQPGQTDRLHLGWVDNSNDELGFRLERGADGLSFAQVAELPVNATYYLDAGQGFGLAVNTSYYYRIRAIGGEGGDSPYSNTAALYTRAGPPALPVLSQVSSATAVLGWHPYDNPAGTLYVAEVSVDELFDPLSDSSATYNCQGISCQAAFSGLVPNTTYFARIKAVNGNGVGSLYSATVSTATLSAPPGAPSFTQLWVSSAGATWSPGDNPAQTLYESDLSTAADFSGTMVSSATRNYWAEIGPLSPNTTYYMRVRAVSASGTPSAYGYALSPGITLARAPAASASPYILNITSVTVFWSIGDNPPNTQYYAQRSGRDSSDFSVVESVSLWQTGRSSWTFTGLSADATYYFRVKARNAAGTESPAGDYTLLPSTQTRVYAPGYLAPQVFVSSVNARWSNLNPGGVYFLAEASEDVSYSVLAASSGWTPDMAAYFFQGLTPNTRYYVRVRARNSSGVETSTVSLFGAYTLAAVPGGHTYDYSRTGNTISINWSSGDNPVATEYQAAASTAADFSADVSYSDWTTESVWQFTGLLPGTEYHFRVRARNHDGAGSSWTMLPSSFTLAAPVPPTGLVLEYTDASSTDRIRAAWNDNSADELGFRLYQSADGLSYALKETIGASAGTGPLSTVAEELSVNTEYYFKVAVFNANGEAYSSAVSTYTRALQPAAQDFSEVLTNSLRVNWSANGNPAGTVYVAEISTAADFPVLSGSSATVLTSAFFAGLEANKDYYARVKAVNGSGVDTSYTGLGSTRTIPLAISLYTADQAPVSITQGQRRSFAKVVVVPSGTGARLTSLSVVRTGTAEDADVSRIAVWRDQNQDGAFQSGNDLEEGGGVFSSSQAAIPLNVTLDAAATFFVVLSAADTYLSWPGNTLGVVLTGTAAFTSPNSVLAGMSPSPLASGLSPLVKLADTLDVVGYSAAPFPNVSRGVYNIPFLELSLNAERDRVFLTGLALAKSGTLNESYIEAIKIYRDTNQNGELEAQAGDELVSSGIDVFSGGQAYLALAVPSTRAVAGETWFVTLDIADNAPLNATVGVSIDAASSFSLMTGSPDSVTLAATPTDSALPAVSDPPNTLLVSTQAMGVVSIAQGQEKALLKLDMTADSGNAVVTSIKVQRSSTSVDTDYTRAALFRDNAPLGEFGGSDTFVASGAFSAGQVTFTTAETVSYTSTRTYFVTTGISASANTSDQAGISIQSGYLTVLSAQTAISAPLPVYSGLAAITPTLDTVLVTPDASVAPSVVYQTAVDVPVLALKLQANANAVDISALLVAQAGTAADTDVASLRVFRDNGDGVFSASADSPVSGPYAFFSGSAAVSFSTLQNITPSSVTYFLAASVAAAAVPGRTLQLRIASAASFNILAPDVVSSTFPILSNAVTLEKLPATVQISTYSPAPSSAEAGTQDIVMERLIMRTTQSTARLNALSLVRIGGADPDISGVALYWDANLNGVADPSELVSSGTFSGGFLSLPFNGSAGDLSVSSRAYYALMGISPSATVNTQLGLTFTGLSVNSPDMVEAGKFPFSAGSVRVAEPVSLLNCVFEDMLSSSVVQGSNAVLAASFTVAASAYSIDWTGLDVLRTGTGYDSDVASLKLYADNGDGVWGGALMETLVAAGTFSGGAAALTFSTQAVSSPESRRYYLALDISQTAAAGKTVGISVPSASYMRIADPDYAALGGFPFGNVPALITPTVDTLTAAPVPLSLAPLLTQGDSRRAVGKLTLRSQTNSVELSGVRFGQSGTMQDADLSEVLLYLDDGDGIYEAAEDSLAGFPAQPNNGVVQFLVSPAQVITAESKVFWLAVSVSSSAAVGATLSLDCANTSYFSITAPDLVDPAVFPFSFAVAGGLLDMPDTVKMAVESLAPAEVDQGSVNNAMLRLRLWTDMDQAVLSRLRVDLSGTVSPSDISAVKLYRDLDYNGALTAPDLLVASGSFSGGYVWLQPSSPQTLSASTRTFFLAYDVSPTAAIGAQARAGLAGAAYFDAAAPDFVDGSSLPFVTGIMSIKEPPGMVSAAFDSGFSTWAAQGQADVLMSSFTLTVSSYSAVFTRLVLGRTGTSPDADLAVRLYRDDGDGGFGGFSDEMLLATAAFSGGTASLDFSPVSLNSSFPLLFFLAADIAPGAQPWKTAGFSVDAAGYISVASPDYLNPSMVFPVAAGELEIQPTNDILYAQAVTSAISPLLTQGDQRRAVGRIILQSGSNSVEAANLRLSQYGTAGPADISEILLYRDDGDGVFISSADSPVTLPSVFSGGSAQLSFSPVQTITTTPKTYWLAVSVATEAAAGATLDLRVPDAGYMTLSDTDSADPDSFPLVIQPAGSIQDRPDTMHAELLTLAPGSVYQGVTGYGMARLKLWVEEDSAVWRRLRLDLTGNAVVADIAAVKLYSDSDGNSLFSASSDTAIASGVFSAGYCWLEFSPQTVTVSTRTYFISYDLSASAVIDATLGLSVAGAAYFSADSPDIMTESGGFSSALSMVRDSRVPVPPSVGLLKGDGSLSLMDLSYTPYETMLGFSWDGTVYQGAIERAMYHLGSSPGVSTSVWTNIGLSKDVSISGINLAHGATYYLSVRAKNVLGDFYSDIVTSRFVVDSFKPLMPAAGTVREELSGIKLEWPTAVIGPSGLAYYKVEERRGDSPVWNVISTTTEKSLIISQTGTSPSGITRAPGSYYYRISAVNGAGVTGESSDPRMVNIGLDRLAAISGVVSYPNPFDSRKRSATIVFTLNQASVVEMTIYDLFGLKVRKFRFAGSAGANSQVWDGTDDSGRKVSKGMYLCVIKAVGDRKVHKIGVIH